MPASQGAAIAATGGGSLTLADLALPLAALRTAEVSLAGAGSTLYLAAVTVPKQPDWGELTGTATAAAAAGGPLVLNPPDLQFPPYFVVRSGPCTVAEGGRCVGRWPGGYLPNEDCEIAVAGVVEGVLGPCPVFDTFGNGPGDWLTLPDGTRHGNADCPAGAALGPGQTLTWTSNTADQGDFHGNGNGLPHSSFGAGGGWQVCFAQ